MLLELGDDVNILTSPSDDSVQFCKVTDLTMIFFADVGH